MTLADHGPETTAGQGVRYERVGALAWITLTRPARLNALDLDGWHALTSRLRQAADDESCRVVAITGSGRAFCAGDDITVFGKLVDRADAESFFLGGMLPALEAIVRHPKPVIAAVNGHAYGGGMEIVALCDLAVAVDSAQLRLPEGRIGAWATVFVGAAPALMTLKQAKAAALQMAPLSAQEAQAVGFINEVVAADRLRDRVTAVADELLAASPHALEITKRHLNRWLTTDGLDRIRETLQALVDETLFTPDLLEGTAAFLEKREPRFTGA